MLGKINHYCRNKRRNSRIVFVSSISALANVGFGSCHAGRACLDGIWRIMTCRGDMMRCTCPKKPVESFGTNRLLLRHQLHKSVRTVWGFFSVESASGPNVLSLWLAAEQSFGLDISLLCLAAAEQSLGQSLVCCDLQLNKPLGQTVVCCDLQLNKAWDKC